MTGMFSLCTKEIVIVAMDTLVSSGEDHTPISFASKIMPLLHARSIICPMGEFDLAMSLFEHIEKNILCKDISSLVHYLELSLNDFISFFINRYNRKPNGTIYIFGFNCILSVFESYKLTVDDGHGVITKCEYGHMARPGKGIIDPESGTLLIPVNPDDIPKTFIQAIETMKKIDDERPQNERWGIGGHSQMAILHGYGYTLTSLPMEDFEEEYEYICSKRK
ncbi:MAG: hypothetical protein E7Z65_07120 [Thermoplasmata archaeon]|nr:hypothetical protein [Thermoplasmata archaeon]